MKTNEFNAIITSLQSGQDLSRDQMRQAVAWFLTGEADPVATRRMLEAMADKGETADELVGAAQALRASMLPLSTRRKGVVDTCGTGGDGAKTFNISTAAALVIAAAGVPVAKHGNRRITSSTGSADVLSELGVELQASVEVVGSCLEELGICFCFAPHFHPAMRHVGPVRRQIDRPTIFNRLGPLANPAGADHQVLGVGDARLQPVMASALQQLGTQRSIVVRGQDGVDEISISAPTEVIEVTPQAITTHVWSPADFGLEPAERATLFADDPTVSAECIRGVLEGRLGPQRDVVVINAAAALWLTRFSDDLRTCAAKIASTIDSGQATKILSDLSRMTQGDPPAASAVG